jgi:hypothetical protein
MKARFSLNPASPATPPQPSDWNASWMARWTRTWEGMEAGVCLREVVELEEMKMFLYVERTEVERPVLTQPGSE